jgi:hypothetical protein
MAVAGRRAQFPAPLQTRNRKSRQTAVTMRVLDVDGSEVHSAVKADSAAGKAFTTREKHWQCRSPRGADSGTQRAVGATRRPFRSAARRRRLRVSRFRGLPRSAIAPTRNCLDFGWRIRRLQISGSLARTCGEWGEAPARPTPRVVRAYRRGQVMIGRGTSSRLKGRPPAAGEADALSTCFLAFLRGSD